MMPYDFRYLTHVQKAILAAGGWRPGDYVVGAAHHSRPSKPCLEGLIRRGFLNVCAPPPSGRLLRSVRGSRSFPSVPRPQAQPSAR